MMIWQLFRLASNPYNITANDINVPTGTGNIGLAFVEVLHFLMILVGSLALIFIIVAGIQMALSAGNSSRFAHARETLLYAVVGLCVALAGYAIISFIAGNL
jgi:Type IV secretion system pilin